MGFEVLQTGQLIKISVIGIQVFVVAIMIIYMIFAFVMTRRVKIMNQNLKTSYARVFNDLSKIHFIASIVVVIISLLSIKI